MHLRETLRRGGLVAFALLAACAATIVDERPVDLEKVRDPADLRALYAKLEKRTDPEAALARARICTRLRDLENPGSAHLLACGDGADLEVLSGAAPAGGKVESAGRLFRHFRERADQEALCRSLFKGPLATHLRRYAMLAVAARLGEYLPHGELAQVLGESAVVAKGISEVPALRPESVAAWRRRSEELERRAGERSREVKPPEPSAEARKFCEAELARHLEEATRASALATKEKADRGDLEKVVGGYLRALEHYVLVRECLAMPTQPQEDALAAMGIVVESLHAILVQEP